MKILILAPDISVTKSERFYHSAYGEFVDDTVPMVKKSLEEKGFEIEVLHCSLNLLSDLKKREKMLVFNLCDDGFQNITKTEPLVAGVIELVGFPYTGSDMFTLALCQHKWLCKELMTANKVRTPRYWLIESEKDLNGVKLDKKLIVKPNFQDGSIGINLKSVVSTRKELETQVRNIIQTFKEPALVEEFIQGREFSVGIVGEEVLPIMECHSPNEYNLKSDDVKWANSVGAHGGLRVEFNKIEPGLEREMKRNALIMKKVMGCRDYMRFDFRVDSKGRSYMIDINPNPGLDSESSLSLMAKERDWSYSDLIYNILKSALKRYEKEA